MLVLHQTGSWVGKMTLYWQDAMGAHSQWKLIPSSSLTGWRVLSRSSLMGRRVLSSSSLTGSRVLSSSSLTGRRVLSSSSLTGRRVLLSSSLTGRRVLSSSSLKGRRVLSSSSLTSKFDQVKYPKSLSKNTGESCLLNYYWSVLSYPSNYTWEEAFPDC